MSRPRPVYPIPVNHSPPVRVDVMRRKPGFKGPGKGNGPEWGFELVRAVPSGGRGGGAVLFVVALVLLLAFLGAMCGGAVGADKE